MSADRVVVLTERIKKILLGASRYLGSKDGAGVTVIPCCVDLTKFRMTEKKDITLANDLGLKGEFVFGYLGSLGTWYMVDEMVEFFRIAKDIFAPARFLFITQTGSEHVYGAVGRSGMDEELFRVIEVGREDVPRALSLVDVGVFFIKPSFSKQASSPTKLAEFLACGVPVVINSGIGDTADVVKDNKIGVVLDGFSVDLYSKATGQLKGLIPEGEPLRKKCRDVAERYYALENACRLYKKVYSDMSVK
jgi:glycosyltransferase involved in cell wall biosynthesis